jgi:hypothetical protein
MVFLLKSCLIVLFLCLYTSFGISCILATNNHGYLSLSNNTF